MEDQARVLDLRMWEVTESGRRIVRITTDSEEDNCTGLINARVANRGEFEEVLVQTIDLQSLLLRKGQVVSVNGQNGTIRVQVLGLPGNLCRPTAYRGFVLQIGEGPRFPNTETDEFVEFGEEDCSSTEEGAIFGREPTLVSAADHPSVLAEA